MQNPPKVIISAYGCEPNAGSELGIGWNWAVQAARHGNEVHVVTRANNRSRIESELARHPVANLHFHYLDLPIIFRWWKRAAGYYGLISYYYTWQVALMFVAPSLHRKHHFDLAHHVTWGNDWMPSGLFVLPTPFIWGPIGGSSNQIPRQIDLGLPAYARRHDWVRSRLQRLLVAADPLVARTRARAKRILAYSKDARAGIPSKHRGKASCIIHIGMSDSDLQRTPSSVPQGGEMRLVMGGRLVHWKGYDLALEGFAGYLRQGATAGRLIVTGGGPYKPVLQDLAGKLGIASHVDFVGHLPTRADVWDLFRTSSLYLLPTLRDGPLLTTLEAMAMGLPILCMRFGSSYEMVPDSAGLKIELSNHDQMVSDIARALAWAATHRDDLQKMGAHARAHVTEFYTWNRIGDEIQAVYEETLALPRAGERA
jgi:glycosyltransferase involved in cell wall biosynthesis